MEVKSSVQELFYWLPDFEDKALLFFPKQELRIRVEPLTKQKALERYILLNSKFKKRQTSKKNWTEEEIQYLLYLVDKLCFSEQKSLENLESESWQRLARLIPGRSEEECMFKALSLKKYSLSEYPWSSQEDILFQEIVENKGENWDVVSRQLYRLSNNKVFRNSKMCRQHYMCFFNPTIKKGPWSPQQDYQLACCYSKIGRKWSKIAKELQGRNQNSIKNRFFLLFETSKNNKKRQTRNIDAKVSSFKAKYQRQHGLVSTAQSITKSVEKPAELRPEQQFKQEISSSEKNEVFNFYPSLNDNYMNYFEL